ncbi:MAG: cytochrome c oxidase subunit II [Bacteroidetes bacterium]|jgi:cytochrome c oxidase subunit 2|nr:cytochrome c oxidase subunit II [Bacteroidota bacterium]MBP7255737.1 cytochrome c oxidase subunit II [Chitinophagales bacterium]MBK7139051.1 cytochrome c oxidase subunit II [Bacteroidota bacterium]MBK7505751.1 cytochrome c oxidase subunit II [Bacteroidota bacterium]MBK7639717.1 cytochrome c oxidase subunit II [Bacteroidota bacterium]
MSAFLLILTVALVIIVVFQIGKSAELARILRGEEGKEETNSSLALITSVIGFIILILSIITIFIYKPKFLPVSASEQGVWIQQMINWTMFFTCTVYIFTTFLLFWFVYKYQYKKDRKAFWFPDDLRLELAWTIIPAIVLTVLVVLGIQKWFKVFSPAPSDAIIVEAIGQQFKWNIRYAGADKILGKKDFSLTNSDNELGINWNDKNSHDDFMADEIVLPVNTPVLFKLGALDVLHNFNLSQFRMKMDCVPGIPTEYWMRPTISTDSMRLITGNPEFDYEVNCSEMCGSAHYNMRKVLKVVSRAEYDKWAKDQSENHSYYKTVVLPAMKEKGGEISMNTDTTKNNIKH